MVTHEAVGSVKVITPPYEGEQPLLEGNLPGTAATPSIGENIA